MEREYKSKVGWWYHLVIILVMIGCVAAFLRTNIAAMAGMLLAALGVLHVFFNTYYRITEDDMLIAHCSIFPEKKIAIADIEALESTVIPVSSYALVGPADHMERREALDAHIADQPGRLYQAVEKD